MIHTFVHTTKSRKRLIYDAWFPTNSEECQYIILN